MDIATLSKSLSEITTRVCQIDDLNHYIGTLHQRIEELKLQLLAAKKDADDAQFYRKLVAWRNDVHSYVTDMAFDGDIQTSDTVDGGCADEDFVPGWYTKNGRRIKLVSAVYEVSEVA